MQHLTDAQAETIQAGRHHGRNNRAKGELKSSRIDLNQFNFAINLAINGGVINNTQINSATITSLL
jgi:hypothetical protein